MRTKISGEYVGVSNKTMEYELMSKYYKAILTPEEVKLVLNWISNYHKMNLKITIRKCRHGWGGVRNSQPFVTLPVSRLTLGLTLHEYAHAYCYRFGTGYNHDRGYVKTFDMIIRRFNKSRKGDIIKLKEKLEIS